MHKNEHSVGPSGTPSAPQNLPTVRKSARSRAFPRERWKGIPAYIVNIQDKKLAFNLATKGENGAKWTRLPTLELIRFERTALGL